MVSLLSSGTRGLIANAENFEKDIATIVCYPCPIDFSEKINLLLNDTQRYETFAKKARERALTFTWEKTAQRIIEIFQTLHEKKKLVDNNILLNVFVPTQTENTPGIANASDGTQTAHTPNTKSIILVMNKYYQRAFIGDILYSQRIEDGIALTLLKNHTYRQAEAILAALVEDQGAAKAILKRTTGLVHATA